MPLEPAIQPFAVNASAYLAGIDEMIEATDRLAEAVDEAVDDIIAAFREAADEAEAAAGVIDDAMALIAEGADEALADWTRAAAGMGDAMDEAAERIDAAVTDTEGALDDLGAAAGRAAAIIDDAADGIVASFDRTMAASDEVAAQMDLAADAAKGSVAAYEAAAAAADELAAALGRAADAADVEGTSAKRATAETEGMGTVMKAALLGVALAAGVGVEQAAKFQSTMLTLSTQAGVSKSQISGLSQGVLEMAGNVGDSPNSLAQALYHVESSFQSVGITGPKALNLLQIAAEGAATGHADLVDVTNALDSTIVAGVPGITSYSGAMGALNAVVGSGDMTMQDLANAMGTGVMAVAKSYGQSIYQVGAALALFGDNNIRGAKAATELRMAWQAMQAPLTTAGPALQSIGLTMTQLGHTMSHQGMSVAVQEFVNHLKAAKVPMSDWGQLETEIFGKKAGVGIGIMVDQLGRLKSKFPDIEKGSRDFGDAWQATQKTLEQQWKETMAAGDALIISFGTVLLPAVTKILRALAQFGVFLEKHPAIAAFAGALLAVAIAFKVVAAAEAVFDAVTDADPIMLVLMAVILVAAGLYELYEHFKVVRDIVADTGHRFAEFIGWLKDAWRAMQEFGDATAKAWDSTVSGAAKAGHDVSHAFSSGWDDVYRDTIGEVVRAFDAVKGAITSGFDGWWKSHGEEIEEYWHAVWAAVAFIFSIAWDNFMSRARPAFEALTEALRAAWAIVTMITKEAWDRVAAFVEVAWDSISTVVKIAVDATAAAVKIGWDLVSAIVKIVWAEITAVVKIAWDLIVGIINVGLDLVTGHWSQAWRDIEATAVQIWNAIRQFWASTLSAVDAAAHQVWNDIRGFLIQTWNAIVTFAEQEFNHIVTLLQQTWNDVYSGVMSVWDEIVAYFKSVPGRILSALGDLGSLLYSAGQAIIQGLINGVKDMTGAAIGAIKSVGGDIIHGAESILHIGSPSKVFYQIGQWITTGLATGIIDSDQQAIDASRRLAGDISAAMRAGTITKSEAADLSSRLAEALVRAEAHVKYEKAKIVKLLQDMGLEMREGIVKGLTGDSSQVKDAIDKLLDMVKDEFNDKLISDKRATAITDWLEKDNNRLQNLATARAKIEATIKAADKYAASVTTSTESWASLSNAETLAGGTSGRDIAAGMQMQLAQIKQFSADIRKLRQRGLSKDLLNEIIQAGPASGLPVAESLLDDTGEQIRSLDATQSAINKYSTSLGKSAAEMMYDSGKDAGKGFLSGLQAQEHAITKEMDKIAESLVKALKKDLKISSPSLVMRELAHDTARGLSFGLLDELENVQGAAHGLSKAITTGAAGGNLNGLRVGGGGATGGGGNVTIKIDITVQGFIGNEQQLAHQLFPLIQEAALQSNHRNPTNGLSLLVNR